MEYIVLIVTAVLVKNIVLAQYLGNCPFLGVSKKMDTAVGMGMAVIFIMALASMITWTVWSYVMVPVSDGTFIEGMKEVNIKFLRTIVFILVIASLVQLVEMFLKKSIPPLYQSLGIFLPLITTNCAILGVAIICVDEGYNFLNMIVFSVASAAGFALALIIFAGIRERFEISDIPKPLEGTAIGLVAAGYMALAFFGFQGVDGSLKELEAKDKKSGETVATTWYVQNIDGSMKKLK